LSGTGLLADSFGLRYAVDADHIAAMDTLTRKLMKVGAYGGTFVRPIHNLHDNLTISSVSFSLHQGEPKMLEDMIEQRELDFAISHLPVANPALQVHPLVALQVAVIARKRPKPAFRAKGRSITRKSPTRKPRPEYKP